MTTLTDEKLRDMVNAAWRKDTEDGYYFAAIEVARAVRDAAFREAAGVCEAEAQRILALQKGGDDPFSMEAGINHNLRMASVMIPECAKKILALIHPSASTDASSAS